MLNLYQLKEYFGGKYYHATPTPLVSTKKGATWVIPCRILDISPAEWVTMLVKEYNAEIYYSKGDGGYYHEIVIPKWKSIKDARAYKNMLNKVARQKEFYV